MTTQLEYSRAGFKLGRLVPVSMLMATALCHFWEKCDGCEQPREARGGSIFTKKTGPAVNCRFLTLASAWPPGAQYTQNYNVITQAGAHSEDSHLGRRTPGARRHKGHSEAEVTCIYIFSRGGWNTISVKIALWIVAWESFGKGLRRGFLFQRGLFPPQGSRGTGGKEAAACFLELT